MVTTPSGFPCAMSHANNGTSDLNVWVGLFWRVRKADGIFRRYGRNCTANYIRIHWKVMLIVADFWHMGIIPEKILR